MLTFKTRYAMLALVRLAESYGQEPLQVSQIAADKNIPKRFLESILQELKNNGYLDSRLGKKGGYVLNKPPDKINLLEIIRLFEGAIALLPCTSEKYYKRCDHCPDENTCTIRRPFKEIREFTYNKLASTTLQSLISVVS